MKIGFFNVENWEIMPIKSAFPEAQIFTEKACLDNVDQFKDLEIISSFIYSELNEEVLKQLPNLKMIATRSTGYDHIDLDYCKANNIVVSNVPVYGERTVAEHTFGLILTLTRKIYDSIERTKKGSFSTKDLRGVDLYNKTIGIIGLGNIGEVVAKIAKGFGMKVLVNCRGDKSKACKEIGLEQVDLDYLLQNSDVVSLHLPYCKETHHIINKENILKFKQGSYLINTARGGLIEVEAIVLGLEKNILAGVALDVLEEENILKEEAELLSSEYLKKVNLEDLVCDYLIMKDRRVIVTPHNAFNSKEALERILSTTIENINMFLKEKPSNVVK
jgi:D-lactate dehydrogenase